MHEFSRVYPIFENVKEAAKGKKVEKVVVVSDQTLDKAEFLGIFAELAKGTNVEGCEVKFKNGGALYLDSVEVE